MEYGGEFNGIYDRHKVNIIVFCRANALTTNRALLEETQHHIQDITGELEAGIRLQKRYLGMVAGATALCGVGAGLVLAAHDMNPVLGAMVAIPAYPSSYFFGYHRAPHELTAKAFASSPDVLETYGNIVSYDQT